MTDEIWLSITSHEGTPLEAFADIETAFDYYGVEKVLGGAAGVLTALGIRSNMDGITWANAALTEEEFEDVFGNQIERPMFLEERWTIHIWHPVDQCHIQIILRPMPIHQVRDADRA